MKLYTGPSSIACSGCGYSIKVDPDPTCWQHGRLRGRCITARCQNYDKLFEFMLPSIEAEFVEGERPLMPGQQEQP